VPDVTSEPCQAYASDLTNEQWSLMSPLIPEENSDKQGGRVPQKSGGVQHCRHENHQLWRRGCIKPPTRENCTSPQRFSSPTHIGPRISHSKWWHFRFSSELPSLPMSDRSESVRSRWRNRDRRLELPSVPTRWTHFYALLLKYQHASEVTVHCAKKLVRRGNLWEVKIETFLRSLFGIFSTASSGVLDYLGEGGQVELAADSVAEVGVGADAIPPTRLSDHRGNSAATGNSPNSDPRMNRVAAYDEAPPARVFRSDAPHLLSRRQGSKEPTCRLTTWTGPRRRRRSSQRSVRKSGGGSKQNDSYPSYTQPSLRRLL